MEGEHHIFIGSLCMDCSDLHLVTIPVYYPFLHQQGLTPAASVTFYTSVTARPPQTADQNDLEDLEDVSDAQNLEELEHHLLPVSRAIPLYFDNHIS